MPSECWVLKKKMKDYITLLKSTCSMHAAFSIREGVFFGLIFNNVVCFQVFKNELQVYIGV